MAKPRFNIRSALFLVGVIAFSLCGWVTPGDAAMDDGMVLGSPQAPLTIVEYSSLTCPHCAAFHLETLPRLKREWIDTGKARLIFRDYPLDSVAFAGSMVAHCRSGNFFPLLDILFAAQQRWSTSPDPRSALMQFAKLSGIPEGEFNGCLSDQGLFSKIRKGQEYAEKTYGVDSTPAFVVGGKLISGAIPYETFDRLLRAAGG